MTNVNLPSLAKDVVTYALTRGVPGQLAGKEAGSVGLGGARPATKAGAFTAVEASLGAWCDATRALVSIKTNSIIISRHSPETAHPPRGDVFAVGLMKMTFGAQSSPYAEVNFPTVEAGAFPAAETGLSAMGILNQTVNNYNEGKQCRHVRVVGRGQEE
jgi:hypothetical protein